MNQNVNRAVEQFSRVDLVSRCLRDHVVVRIHDVEQLVAI
jgi:hypothetical protein